MWQTSQLRRTSLCSLNHRQESPDVQAYKYRRPGLGQPSCEHNGGNMKKALNLFILSALLLLPAIMPCSEQESYLPDKGNELNRAVMTVRGNELNSGVVILDIVKSGKAYELQCNQGASGCTALKNGKYQIVELPKNFGMYDCRVVEVYPEFAVDPQRDRKLGEYCLIEK